MIELPEPKCYTHISWLKAPSGCIVTEPHASFPISLFTADQLRTYGDQRAAEAREQMREECVKICNKNVGFFEGSPRETLHPLHQRELEISEDIAKAIKEIP